jgi:hypothetical protein
LTDLTLTQVNNWFINARRRIWRPIVEKRHEQQQATTQNQPQQPTNVAAPIVNQAPSSSPRNVTALQPQQMMTSFTLNPPSQQIPPQHIPDVNHHGMQNNNSQARQPKQEENFRNVFNAAFDGQDQNGMVNQEVEQYFVPDEIQRPRSNSFLVEDLEGVEIRDKKRKREDPNIIEIKDPTEDARTPEAFVEENYSEMLEEYNRLRKENNNLKNELNRVSNNFQKMFTTMSQRHEGLQAKISEMEAMHIHLETSNNDMAKKLYETKRIRLSRPIATRPEQKSNQLSSDNNSAFKSPSKPKSSFPSLRETEAV